MSKSRTVISVPCQINVDRGARVLLTTGTVALAGAVQEHGTVVEPFVAANYPNNDGKVAIRISGEEHEMIAGGAIAQFANWQTAASGKIVTGGSAGYVLEAAAADGDRIRVVRF